MKNASKLTIVIAAVILAAGCRSSQERASRNENSSPAYGGASAYENRNTTSSATTPGQYGNQSFTPGSSQNTDANAGQPGLTENDRTLSRQVQHQLQNDPSLAAAAPNIQVTAQNGTVILSGSVKSDQDKEKIESTVRSMNGVVSVNNQLQVSLQPTSESSGKSSRIYSEPSSQSAAIKSDSASQTSLSSSPTPDKSTQGSAAADQTQGAKDKPLSPASNNGNDTAQSDTKDQASTATPDKLTQGAAAADQTQGTKDKQALSPTSAKGNDTSRVYSKDQNDSTPSSSSSQTLDASTSQANIQATTDTDRALGQQVLSSLQADASLTSAAPMIKIKVDSGKVILRGTVKSDQEKQNIEAAAQKVSGVTSVDNRLKVGSPNQNNATDKPADSTATPAANKNP